MVSINEKTIEFFSHSWQNFKAQTIVKGLMTFDAQYFIYMIT